MKAFRTILAFICVAALASACGGKENGKVEQLSVSFNTAEVTLTGTTPVKVSYSARGYNGTVTVEDGFLSPLVEKNFRIDNRFDSASGQGELTFTQTTLKNGTYHGFVLFSDSINSVKKDLIVRTVKE